MSVKERRRIDWRLTVGEEPPRAKLVAPAYQTSEFGDLASTLMSEPSTENIDRLIKYSVEFSRIGIHLERTAIFLFDANTQAMVGTWGTTESLETIDEHDLQYDFGELDREIFKRAEQGYAWTVYDDCPHMTQSSGETRIIGRGWTAGTAILGTKGPIGVFWNDAGITHAEVDEAKQARAAVLCGLLARAIETARAAMRAEGPASRHPHRLVREVNQLLVRDPSLSCEALAQTLNMSSGQLARTFKHYAQRSIVDHRNEIRLARFLGRVDTKGGNLLEAALESGFGSYAQFHRVFRARFGQAPREYLLEHGPNS